MTIFKNKRVLLCKLLIQFLIVIVVISIIHYIFIDKFVNEHSSLAIKIKETFIDETFSNNQYITEDSIIIKNNNIFYELKDKKFLVNPNITISEFPKIQINNNVFATIAYIIYDFDNIQVIISINHVNVFSSLLLCLLTFAIIISSIVFHIIKQNNKNKIYNLKVATHIYALSERTTSYLINIMHHKLNTPLKIMATKSRVLIETIIDSELKENVKEKAEWDYVQIDRALKTIFMVTNKLKSYNELSQNEINLYRLFTNSKDTIDILKDDEFEIDIDYKTKLFNINKNIITSHEIMQIFINQIKFSLTQLADKISIKIFKYDEHSITILYSDNGNKIDDKFENLIKNNLGPSIYNDLKLENDYFDIVLNFNILNTNQHSSIRLLSSNKNGSIFEIKLPIYKINIKK